MTVFLGLALADSMFPPGSCSIQKCDLVVEDVKAVIAQGVESCCNPSHVATINAIRSRFGIEVPISKTPLKVTLGQGDSLVVISPRGLPRLTDRHEYTAEEIAKATFSFSVYTVIG